MGPASAALAAGMSTGSALQRQLHKRPRATAAAIACAAVGSGAFAWHARRDGSRLRPRQQRCNSPPPSLSPPPAPCFPLCAGPFLAHVAMTGLVVMQTFQPSDAQVPAPDGRACDQWRSRRGRPDRSSVPSGHHQGADRRRHRLVACCVPDATACGATAQSSPQCAALLSSSGAATGASSGCELGGVTQHRCPCIVPPTCTYRTPLCCVGEVSGAGPEDVGAPARAAGRGLSALRVPWPVRRAGHRRGGVGGHRGLLPPQVRIGKSHHRCLAASTS